MTTRSTLTDVDRLIRAAGSIPALYRPETISYWLHQGYSPQRIVTEILRLSHE